MKEQEKDFNEWGNFPNYAKPDCELYKDEDDVVHSVIEVKRNKSKNNEEWTILENKKIVLVVPAKKLTNKEKNILYTVNGIKLLINLYKNGNTSFSKIKKGIHDNL